MSGMANQATYDDANLVLRLFELRREEKLRQAREWFARSLSEHRAVAELFPQGAAVRSVSTARLGKYFTGHASKPDVPLMLDALFMTGKLGYN